MILPRTTCPEMRPGRTDTVAGRMWADGLRRFLWAQGAESSQQAAGRDKCAHHPARRTGDGESDGGENPGTLDDAGEATEC